MTNYWQTEKIRLRAPENHDLERYISKKADPNSVRQLLYDIIEPPASEADIRKNFENALTEFGKGDKRIFIIETLAGEYAGEICIWFTDLRNRVFKYGIFLEDNFRGQHIGHDALVIVLDYYFNELGYNKASPTVYEFNKASAKFHEKFGFKHEGCLRGEVYTRGQYFDMHCYGMLKTEFNALYKHFVTL